MRLNMKSLKITHLIVASFFIYSCSFNLYYQLDYFDTDDFQIDSTQLLAVPSFVATDTERSKETAKAFMDLIEPQLVPFVIDPSKTDSILVSNQIYALPNELPHDLLTKLANILEAKFILIGYLLDWNEADLGQDGIVKHRIDIYDLASKQLIWTITSKVVISSPDEDETIYFITSASAAYEKLVKKTLKKLSEKSNIRGILYSPYSSVY